MKSKTKNLVFLLIIGLVFPLIINFNFNFSINYKPSIENPKTSGTYNGIWIDDTFLLNGSNFGNWTWARTQPWCTKGNGTQENPYVIEDSTFLSSGLSDCLTIRNSIKHFIIENCTFKDIPVANYAGLELRNVTNGQLIDNQAYNNYFGIYLYESDDNIIMGNTVNNNSGTGIYLNMNCDDNNIMGNTASLNYIGIYLASNCDRNTLSGNTVNNNDNTGIYLEINCDNNTLSGNTANLNWYGITLNSNCSRNTLSGNTANYNNDDGITLNSYCSRNTLSGNTVNNNDHTGIYLVSNCDNNTLSGNTANNNHIGIYLDSYCSRNTLSGNTASNNPYDGVYLVNNCDNNTLLGNTANNNWKGILIYWECDNNTITENVLYNNTQGIEISSINCNNNSIYKNFFLENEKHAVDYGTDNTWNSTSIGNYWDNWTSPDVSPNDGIVDDAYTYIGGTAGSIDYLPIAEDGAPVIVINSPDPGDVFGVTAPSFDVIVTDIKIDSLWYTIDGGINNYTFTEFTGTIEQLVWDALSDGMITLTFYASDVLGNIGSTELTIIKDTHAPTITIISPADDEVFGASAPAFIIMVNDESLDSMWYSLDGGLTTFAITKNATIDQAAWTALPEGSVTITFYANDTLGNLTFEEVTIAKSIPAGGIDPTVIIVVVIVSIVGGVAVIAVVYIFMKKRATPV